MDNPGKWLILAVVLIILSLLVAFGIGETQEEEIRVVSLPELAACSCDSAYRCMSDQDYMQLVAWQEENRWLTDIDCRGC